MIRCVLAIMGSLILFTACFSCAVGSDTVSLWGTDAVSPSLVELCPVSTLEVDAWFSAPVTVVSSRVQLDKTPERVIETVWALRDYGSAEEKTEGEGCCLRFAMEEGPAVGEKAYLTALVEDEKGNSYSFCVPFTGYNERVAALAINEVRTEYDKPKVEYIEFIVTRAGNIAGIEIYNAGNATVPYYEFPSAEVCEGDYIVWHLRSLEEGLVNETIDTDESSGTDATITGRDFWDTQTKAPLKKTNVIMVRERKGGIVMDALLVVESGKSEWPNDVLAAAAEAAVSCGAWGPTSLVGDAVCSTGTTPTRTIGRNEFSSDTNTRGDWAICLTGKRSPGVANPPFPASP